MRCRKNCTAALAMGALVLLWMPHAAQGQQSEPAVLTLQQAEELARKNHPGIRAAK